MSQALAAQGSSETSSRALLTKNSQSFCADILHELSFQYTRDTLAKRTVQAVVYGVQLSYTLGG